MTRAIDIISEQVNDNARALAIGLCVAGMFAGAWMGFSAKPVRPAGSYCQLQAITPDGNLYVLGAGTTCESAVINHAAIPYGSTVRFEVRK